MEIFLKAFESQKWKLIKLILYVIRKLLVKPRFYHSLPLETKLCLENLDFIAEKRERRNSL